MEDVDKKVKKRKKHTDGSSRPAKKVAIEEDRKIKISLQKEDEWAPIIGMQTTSQEDVSLESFELWAVANIFLSFDSGNLLSFLKSSQTLYEIS